MRRIGRPLVSIPAIRTCSFASIRGSRRFPNIAPLLIPAIDAVCRNPLLADSKVRRPPQKAARSCSKCNSCRDLLQSPIGTLVGTTAIAAKCEDVPLSESLSMGTRGVLILSSIRCRAPRLSLIHIFLTFLIFKSKLDSVFQLQGLWIWLAFSVFSAGVASLLPARSAAKLTVREALAYE